MKLAPLLLAVSLAANLALAAFVFQKPSTPRNTVPVASKPPASHSTPATHANSSAALHAALAAGDAAALETAGLPATVVKDLTLGRSIRQLAERTLAAKAVRRSDDRWWRHATSGSPFGEETSHARRELSDTLVAALGEDPFTESRSSLDFLPAAKRTALLQITRDYDEMIASVSTGGIQLASDREKLRLLRAERERDIAALLTPDELTAYEFRTSPSAATVRARFGNAIETEEDFRALFTLQKAFDEKFSRDAITGRISPETMRARAEAERQLQADIRAMFGEEKYAALRRASDADLNNVNTLVNRLNLPTTAADRIAAARDTYAAESQRINSDSSLSPQDRRARIQELGQRAKAEVAQTLGSEAADAYGQRSPWLNFLQSGMAYSTSPQDAHGGMSAFGQSVYPIMAAGASAGVRHMVGFSSSNVSASTAGTFTVPASGPQMTENIQIVVADPATSSSAPVSGSAAFAPAVPPVNSSSQPVAPLPPKQ